MDPAERAVLGDATERFPNSAAEHAAEERARELEQAAAVDVQEEQEDIEDNENTGRPQRPVKTLLGGEPVSGAVGAARPVLGDVTQLYRTGEAEEEEEEIEEQQEEQGDLKALR